MALPYGYGAIASGAFPALGNPFAPPVPPPPPSPIVGSLFVSLAADASVVPGPFVTLLSVPFTGAGSKILIDASWAASNAGVPPATAFFRLAIAGLPVAGAGNHHTMTSEPSSGAFTWQAAIAGPGIVTLEWTVSGGTGQIRPVTTPGSEHAALRVLELL